MRKDSVPRISRQAIALALCACWSAAWAVEWISVPSAPVYRGAVGNGTRAADGTSWFARRFVNAGEIGSASWTVSGLGVFEVFVNGKRVGDDFLKPGFTHNGKTKYSFSYDVTDSLKRADGDENVLAAEVSAGWWRDKIVTPEHTSSDRGFVGDKSAFRGELTIDYADGTCETIATGDDGWLCGVAGRVKHAAIYDGEEFDARERDPVLGDGLSERPEVNTEFKGDVLPSRGAEVTLRRDLEMVRGPYALKKGTPLIVDFGQNCAAVPEFRFKAARGTVLTALPAEMLNDADAPERGCDGPKGSVYRANLRCQDEGMRLVYTFAGDGVESYLPRFTFFGYRYLSLTATDDVEIESIASVPVTSIGKDMELGRLETGDAAVNRLVSNIYWSQLSNYLSVPTDCPQRNERLGWTADTQVFCEAGAFNADTAAFFRKWMRDMRDTQDEKGGFPGVAPFAQYGSGAHEMMRVGWADAGVVVPYKVWLMFGDRTIVDENWSALERFMARAAQTKYRTGNLPECSNFQWNDWLSLTRLESSPYKPELSAFDKESGRPKADALFYWNYLGGCHWLMDAQMMAQMAAATGRNEAKYIEMAREARDYLRREFFEEDGRISPVLRGMQTPALFALKLGLVDHEAKEWMIADLKASFKANGGTFHTGFLGTSILLETLSECGLDSCAYDLLLNHSFPGWLYSVDQGATTVWERWNSYTKENGFAPVEMNSFNHYAYGAVLAWMYKNMAGIAPDPEAPGFRRIVMAPKPDRRMGFVKAEYKSAAGVVKSEWHYEDEDWIWDFTVPDGATARVTVPGEEGREYGPGTYRILRPGRQGAAIVSIAAETLCASDALNHVDPLIGTEGTGSEYGGMMPYCGVPFGSFQLVPMTRLNRVGQLSFNNADDTLIGFILTRQPAIWMGDWGEVRIPIEPAKIESACYTPYMGCVTAGGRTFEFTATAHAAWLRGDMRDVRLTDGFNANRDDANLGRDLTNFKGWRCVRRVDGGIQIGVSLISLDEARASLAREIGERSFDEVVAATKAAWEDYFGRIEIDAPEEVKTIFYTGLFHTLLYPRQIDEQGRYYSAFDDKVHDGTMYSCYSLWDTYRAEHPWLTLIAPERVDGMMQSLLEMYREGGWLPKWPNPGYTGIMTGAPAEIVLEEARMKGFAGFDRALAREAIEKNRTVPQRFDAARRWRDREEYGDFPETRAGLTSYLASGYVSCDETDESVSRTLDFSLADRNRNYTNLWCASAGLFLPRRKDGSFDAGAPHAYTECTPGTALWCVPHDPEGLVELMGGRDVAVKRLDAFFDTLFWVPERGNKSIHGNEPSHHCAYLYNRFGAPEKTQRRVREILTRAYSTDRKGFDGNEDCGQMSAWYVFSALGFYPLDPASGFYEIGSPLVKGAILRFGVPYAPATLEIRVRGYAPDRWRVRRVTLNGVELADWRIAHADLVKGGVLVFEMAGD